MFAHKQIFSCLLDELMFRQDLMIKIIDFGSAVEEDGALTRFSR